MSSVASVRPMTEADLPFGLRLSLRAGWNQTEADWRRCLDLQPDGCFTAGWDGTPAGTTTICIFGDIAWVAMVLVDDRFRGRDIPVHNAAATRAAESQGLTVQRYLTRMCRGTPPRGRPDWLWAGFGPEKG